MTIEQLRAVDSITQCLKAHTICATNVFFLSLFSCNFDDQLSKQNHIFVVLYIMLGYNRWEKWSLTTIKGVQCLCTTQRGFAVSLTHFPKIIFHCLFVFKIHYFGSSDRQLNRQQPLLKIWSFCCPWPSANNNFIYSRILLLKHTSMILITHFHQG